MCTRQSLVRSRTPARAHSMCVLGYTLCMRACRLPLSIGTLFSTSTLSSLDVNGIKINKMAHTYTNRADNRSPTWLNDAGFIALCLVCAWQKSMWAKQRIHTHTSTHPPNLTPPFTHPFFHILSCKIHRHTHARSLTRTRTASLAAAAQMHIVSHNTNERKRKIYTQSFVRSFVHSFLCLI